jgi:hypothetical protein
MADYYINESVYVTSSGYPGGPTSDFDTVVLYTVPANRGFAGNIKVRNKQDWTGNPGDQTYWFECKIYGASRVIYLDDLIANGEVVATSNARTSEYVIKNLILNAGDSIEIKTAVQQCNLGGRNSHAWGFINGIESDL